MLRTTDVSITTTRQVLGAVTHPSGNGVRTSFTLRIPTGSGVLVSLGDSTVTAGDGLTLTGGQERSVWDSAKGLASASQTWHVIGDGSVTGKLTEEYTV